ncbi:hypothetical protein EIP86_008600 [Pleurotus ostreatoroseus]|nr:hypothetical protein EIP86_008600 [Pleurotus ostreatoroseus]
MDEERGEGRILATFEKYEEFVALQHEMLEACATHTKDLQGLRVMVRRLSLIYLKLDEYQEQAYLLDQYLERLVNPVVEQLKSHVALTNCSVYKEEIECIALLLYHYVKFRGYKSITRFFPHEVTDLSTALNFLLLPDGPTQDHTQWPLRYVMLLWLSLICMLPFDLAQFDEPDSIGKTARDLEDIAKSHLSKAGVEREGAAIMLARLYARKDMIAKFSGFLQWCEELVQDPTDPISCIGAFQVLSELTKTGSAAQIESNLSALLRLTNRVDKAEVLASCTLLRKYRIKLVSRILLRLLPARTKRARGKALLANPEELVIQSEDEDDVDVPDETEQVLQDLFKALQDKDTIVRYSSAKAVARIAERLPSEFAEQVLDQVLQLFTIHSLGAATLYDMPSIAEGTWHGACLSCAEMARRSLIPDSRLDELFGWMKKALYFDIRRGANSVGSSVRDAASYVLWSIARAQSVSALEPFATTLAQTLVPVAVFDREVHIRRAASAAFQEFVGRTGLFPCGIDVLRKTDFYAVGTRRHAFLKAAVEVAEHTEYRHGLLEHLISISLRHWDPAIRRLAAQSLQRICSLDLKALGLACVDRITAYLTFPDSGDIHGALLALSEVAAAFGEASGDDMIAARRKVFMCLANVPSSTLVSRRHELITAAACELIAHAISSTEANSAPSPKTPPWRETIDFGLKSSNVVVQEAAASAMAASICRVLGVLDYAVNSNVLLQAIDFLVSSVDRSVGISFSLYFDNEINHTYLTTTEVVERMLNSFLAGLDDYTTDERGDVGSWVRIACVKGLASFAEILMLNAALLPDFKLDLPAEKYHELLGGILKQGVERLDNVRQQAGEQFIRLLSLPPPQVDDAESWRIHGAQLMKDLFLSGEETIGWNEGAWLFPKVVQLLDIKQYRKPILKGLVLSASTKTDSTQRPVSASLVSYTQILPTRDENAPYDLSTFAADLLSEAKLKLASNNIVIPVLQCFNLLLENDVFEAAAADATCLLRSVISHDCSLYRAVRRQALADMKHNSLQMLMNIASRNISRIKNVQRIDLSMRIVVNMLSLPALRASSIEQLPNFLAHQYPKIRANTAEYLYLILQSKDVGGDTDEAEGVILETEWSSSNVASVHEAALQCAKLLAAAGEEAA